MCGDYRGTLFRQRTREFGAALLPGVLGWTRRRSCGQADAGRNEEL